MGWPEEKKFDDSDKLTLEKDKVVKVQILDDEPELYYTHFVEGKSTKCSGPGCSHCSAGVRRDEKGTIGVFDCSDGKKKALKGTSAMFRALHETILLCGGRKGFLFAMKATGDKKDRRYHITGLPATNQVVSEPDKAAEEAGDPLPF